MAGAQRGAQGAWQSIALAVSGLAVVTATACEGRGRAAWRAPAEAAPHADPQLPVGTTVTLEIPGDQAALVAHAPEANRRAVVVLHGMCASPREDMAALEGTAREHGTLIALVGDVPCTDKPGLTTWTQDAAAIDARVDAALRAASQSRRGALDEAEVTLLGVSQGASRAEALARLRGARYTRLVLVGAPTAPDPASFPAARAVATLAGERERQDVMRGGARTLDAAGRTSRFFSIPSAAHGDLSGEGPRVLGEALAFVHAAP